MRKNEFTEASMNKLKTEVLIKHGYLEQGQNYGEEEVLYVLHESEFLREVIIDLKFTKVDTEFLSEVTGVSATVFENLYELEDRVTISPDYENVVSIIRATCGVVQFAKLALDYYGIYYFVGISQAIDDMEDLGDGFYKFYVC
ncbi:hypothetical protein [Bacillus sp. LL01]|uniref:hypothetical protein n=1 Tax=Bacillus sp. LL01 TaxID=1665556 RepID=UPI000ACD100C|nr:hypothetical protein [Bacillus sp. LL01]